MIQKKKLFVVSDLHGHYALLKDTHKVYSDSCSDVHLNNNRNGINANAFGAMYVYQHMFCFKICLQCPRVPPANLITKSGTHHQKEKNVVNLQSRKNSGNAQKKFSIPRKIYTLYENGLQEA